MAATRIKLKQGLQLTMGTEGAPVDLIHRDSGLRMGLSADEAAVAMLLMEGTPQGADLVELVRRHGVEWDLGSLQGYLARLDEQGLLEEQEAPGLPAMSLAGMPLPADGAYDEEDTDATTMDVPDDFEAFAGAAPLPLRADVLARTLPGGRDVELVEPLTEECVRISHEQHRLAALFDGAKSAPDVAVEAHQRGMSFNEDQVKHLAMLLYTRGLLDRAPAMASTARRHEGAAPPTGETTRPADDYRAVARGRPAASAPASPARSGSSSVTAAKLVKALVLFRDNRTLEATDLVQEVLEVDPDNKQALFLLKLIGQQSTAEVINQQRQQQTPAPAPAAARKRNLPLIIVAVVIFTLCILGLLIPVPARVTVPCKATPIAVGKAAAGLTGVIQRVAAGVGQAVRGGELIAVVKDPKTAEALKQVRERLKDHAELLRIMRTGGTPQDPPEQKRVIEQLEQQIASLGACADDVGCKANATRLGQRLETAKAKLKHTEWKAFPDEIQAQSTKVQTLRERVDKLTRRPLSQEVRSPVAGVVRVVAKEGATIEDGAVVAEFIDLQKFEVRAQHEGDRPKNGTAVTVTLAQRGATQSFRGGVVGGDDKTLRVLVQSDVRKVSFGGQCQASLKAGKQFLIQALFN